MTQWLIVMLLVVISGCSTSNGGLNPDLTHSNEIVSAVGYASISEQSGRTQEEKSLRAMQASSLDARIARKLFSS